MWEPYLPIKSLNSWKGAGVAVVLLLVVVAVVTLAEGCRILQHAILSCPGTTTQQCTVRYLAAYGCCDVTALKSPKSTYHSRHSDSTRDCLQWSHRKYVVV